MLKLTGQSKLLRNMSQSIGRKSKLPFNCIHQINLFIWSWGQQINFQKLSL